MIKSTHWDTHIEGILIKLAEISAATRRIEEINYNSHTDTYFQRETPIAEIDERDALEAKIKNIRENGALGDAMVDIVMALHKFANAYVGEFGD